MHPALHVSFAERRSLVPRAPVQEKRGPWQPSRSLRRRVTRGGRRNLPTLAAIYRDKPRNVETTYLHPAKLSQMRFVETFRQASPYVESLRESRVVILISGGVMANSKLRNNCLKDIAMLHQLGLQLVLVVGTSHQIDERLREQGLAFELVNGYRITDCAGMKAASEAAGINTVEVAARLSKGPSIMELRRQGIPSHIHQRPMMSVISGNYVAAKRRGVVDGVDFKETGEVRYVDAKGIARQLKHGSIVLMSNLGHDHAGDVLNCHTFEIGAMAAVSLGCEKMVTVLEEGEYAQVMKTVGGRTSVPLHDAETLCSDTPQMYKKGESLKNLMQRMKADTPLPLGISVAAGRLGVKRMHLLNSNVEGAMLLELYTRDGIGLMVFSDDYDVTRRAQPDDVAGIQTLLAPLAVRDLPADSRRMKLKPTPHHLAAGTTRARSEDEILRDVSNFTLLVRKKTVIGCAALTPYPESNMAEVAAFAIHPDYQGSGRGDRLLTSLEQAAREWHPGTRTLFLLTTRTADWFEQRGFIPTTLMELPEGKSVDPTRNSKMFVKQLTEEGEENLDVESYDELTPLEHYFK
ncbi:hypothetical protein CYMTET_21458 [Cymbomonas tetramitiformis]|uniref:amino-acid N-acetyltransferase n=1 Tax=Cymbomonas tetramitiformis TaxID=36881 RepID=A0AAE0G2S8_9CHLO|nr:hypothetical protein CYMTET_21458 [Cymbomonas tetramitiformis]